MGKTSIKKSKKRSEEIRILAAVPRGGFGHSEASDNREDIAYWQGKLAARSSFVFYKATIGRIFQAKAREEFGKYALMHNCDYLFMIDDDMLFPLDIFEQLYKHDIDIVAALAFQRRKPYFPVIYIQREGFDPVRKEAYFTNEIVRNYPKNTLFECDAVGFGAVLIKAEVLKKMNEPRFMSTNPSGEDILFCYNARKAGFKVFVDTACKTTHLGAPLMVNEELYEKYNKLNREYLGEASYAASNNNNTNN